MNNDNDTVQVDFGTHDVTVTFAQLRRWHESPQYIDEMRAAFKVDAARDSLLDLVHSIADQTPGVLAFDCEWCGASTYGAQGVIGSTACDACDMLAGLDNMVNDSGQPMDDDTRAEVIDLLQTIHCDGGDARRALETCDFLHAALTAFNAWHHDHVGAGEGREDHSIC